MRQQQGSQEFQKFDQAIDFGIWAVARPQRERWPRITAPHGKIEIEMKKPGRIQVRAFRFFGESLTHPNSMIGAEVT